MLAEAGAVVTVVEQGQTFVGLTVVVAVGADQHLGVAVAVDVAGSGERICEARLVLVALGGPRGARAETRGGTQVERDPTLVELGVVVHVGADQHISKSVAVDVAGGGHGAPVVRRSLVVVAGPRGSCIETCRRAVEDPGLTSPDSRVVGPCADDDIAESIAVDIACGGR